MDNNLSTDFVHKEVTSVTGTAMQTHLTFAKTDSEKIYICQSEEELKNFTGQSGNGTKLTSMAFYDMQVAAFQNLTIKSFNDTRKFLLYNNELNN